MTASRPKADTSFQGLILTLHDYWARHGCAILQPYDMEVGAGTFHPATTLRARPRPMKAAIVASTVEHVWPLVAGGSVRTATTLIPSTIDGRS